jgi:hypothetical protein
MKKLLVAGVAVAALSLVPTGTFAQVVPVPTPAPAASSTVVVPWIIIGCAGGIILSAFHASDRHKRELTAFEAGTCGLGYFLAFKIGENESPRPQVVRPGEQIDRATRFSRPTCAAIRNSCLESCEGICGIGGGLCNYGGPALPMYLTCSAGCYSQFKICRRELSQTKRY